MTDLKRFVLAVFFSAVFLPGIALAESDCTDGLDNDGDLLVDCLDPSCLGAVCDDGLFCTVGTVCDAGLSCSGGSPLSCDDSVGCTDDSCDEVGDACVNAVNDGNCDNGAFCDGAETCSATLDCQAGIAPNCSDGIGCTDDSCDEVGDACVNTVNDGNCDNGDFCDGSETCDAVLDCQAGTAPNCDDSVGCTDDTCDEVGDACVNTVNDENCDNGAFCDGAETCSATLDCQAGTAPNCDDSIGCTDDSCDEVGDACVNAVNDGNCDNGAFCDGSETCSATLDCQAGIAPNCSDGIGCTDDSCDEGGDACVNAVNDGSCDNGQFCDGVETCSATLDCEAGTAPNCNDGVGCTDDSCDEVGDTCVNTANDGNCDDGAFCNGTETCDAVLDCQAGTAPNCNDGVGCTNDSCNETSDACDNNPDDGICDDGAFCNGAETCDAVSDCMVGATPNCDDGVSCTTDSCNETIDSCVNATDDAVCDNGLFCDGAETCDAVLDCQAGAAPNCDDGVGCTSDACNEVADQCDNTADDATCDDGLFCNGAETCNVSTDCQAGAAPNCNDGVGCTIDACNETSDSCDNTADDSVCDDGAFCNGAETCDAALDCQTAAPVDCNDGVACTNDTCNEIADVCENGADDGNCDDGAFCNGAETCDAVLDCQAATPVDCDDAVGCTLDSCNEVADQCDNLATDSLCDNGLFCDGAETCDAVSDCQPGAVPGCDDGVGCTVDACDEVGDTCANTTDDSLCDNGLFCDGAETCSATLDCQAGTAPNCNDGVGCTLDSCNETTDVCDNAPADGLCDDGAFCNGAETCDAALDCQAAAPVDCDDAVACTVDACNEIFDRCDNTATDALCDDGTFCNGAETCDALLDCQAGPPPTCDDGVPCTIDACNTVADTCSNLATDSLCDDGLFCNGPEVCDAATGCEAGIVVDCDDGVACTIDNCDEVTDSCGSVESDALCDNGFFCDGMEICDIAAGCQTGSPVDCDDAVGCTIDGCDEALRTCVNAPNPAVCDDGITCNGIEVCDLVLDCQPSPDPPCDDGIACTNEVCDDVTDTCVSTPDDLLCDDLQFCNGTESCDAMLGCLAGVAIDCTDGVDCTVDTCNETSDVCESTPDDVFCDDGEFCNGVEACNPIFDCESGPVVDCSGSTVGCAEGYCNEVADACGVIPHDDMCDNGLFCDGRETCDLGGTCNAGAAVDCSALSGSCGTGFCDELGQACEVLPMNEGAACDDGDPCTPADVCSAGVCLAGGTTCGNGALDVACGEQCDPPSTEVCDNLLDDDGDGLIDCLDDDCDAIVGPTCSDQCVVVSACKGIGRTKAKIRFAPGSQDQFMLRSQVVVSAAVVNPIVDGFKLLLSNANGPIYRAELLPGDIVFRRPGRYRYIDRTAKAGPGERDGLAQVSIMVKEVDGQDMYVFRVKAWNDLSLATLSEMTLQVTGVDDVATLTTGWGQRSNGWRLNH